MSSAHSPTLLPLHLRHRSFYNNSAALPTSQIILEPFRCFTYVTGTSKPCIVMTFLTLSHQLKRALPLFSSSYGSPMNYPSGPSLLLHLCTCPYHCCIRSSILLTTVLSASRNSPGEPPMHRGWKNSLLWTSVLQWNDSSLWQTGIRSNH